jgi:hypothetical protein
MFSFLIGRLPDCQGAALRLSLDCALDEQQAKKVPEGQDGSARLPRP